MIAIDTQAKTEHLIADFIVPNDCFVPLEEDIKLVDLYLSIETKLIKKALDCMQKNCKNVKNLQVNRLRSSILIPKYGLKKISKFHVNNAKISMITINDR